MPYRAILFDYDGVTLKSMEQHYEAWNKAFAEQGRQIKKEEFFLQEGQGLQTIAETLGKRYHLSDDAIRSVIENKPAYFKRLERVELYDGLLDLLKEMKRRGIAMGVVTGGNRARVQPVFETHFSSFFKCLVTIDDVEQGKPFPEPYLKGARLLGVEPEACLVVENAPLGIQAGRAAGMFVIAVETTLSSGYLAEAQYIAKDFRGVRRKIESLLAEQELGNNRKET